jgi:Flp pilus assembly protein TadB
MTGVVMAALGSALGVIGVVIAVSPASRSLRSVLAELERSPARVAEPTQVPARSSWTRVDLTLGSRLSTFAFEHDYLRERLWPLFAITNTPVQEFFREVILASIVGFTLPWAWWIVVGIAGVHVPLAAPLWAGVLLGTGGAVFPALALTSKARRAQQSARRAVGSFLNLVVLCLAGGMGIESALLAAARIGDDGMSGRILDALILAQDAGEPPWDALARLGRELGLNELGELAAAVVLAGTEGARIRSTLSAKASSIRRHDLARAESEANTMTERLFLPGVCLLVGFLSFIAYPAIARISAGL